MNIKIFDVAHGFCSLIMADNNNLILIDCGSDGNNFSPTNYLRKIHCSGIESFVISNYDEDHITDLPNIIANYQIDVLYRNKSIAPTQLENIKLESGPITPAMRSAITLSTNYSHPVSVYPDFAGIEMNLYQNDYPTFTDTNNLSIVTFIEYYDFSIVYTGDLESAGWDNLLENSYFQDRLRKVNIFVASHHGRKSGFNAKVFEFCKPDIIIISDKEVIYETQRHNYSQYAKGITWNNGQEKRYVLSTRNDGHINIDIKIDSSFFINTKYGI